MERMVLQATQPDMIKMSLTMTMTLQEWRGFQKQLADAYPSWKVSSAISDMVRQAQTEFTTEHVVDP